MSKTILITGSSSGFGRLTTETLLQKGYTVIATMIGTETFSASTVADIKKFAKTTNGELIILELDVTNQKSIDKAIKEAFVITDNIDVLINNAGIGGTGWTEAFPEEQMKKMFDVNVFGVQRMIRSVLPQMRKRNKGLIINFSSIQGRIVFPYSGIYTATKFAVEGLSESYHYELKKLGIDVVILEPGGFKTNFESVQTGPADKERLAAYGDLENKPDEVWGKPGDDKDFLPHPQPVPDAICNIIEMPHGERPLRMVIDPLLGGEGPKNINSTAEIAQSYLSNKLNWGI